MRKGNLQIIISVEWIQERASNERLKAWSGAIWLSII